jgi:hypothetical protein
MSTDFGTKFRKKQTEWLEQQHEANDKDKTQWLPKAGQQSRFIKLGQEEKRNSCVQKQKTDKRVRDRMMLSILGRWLVLISSHQAKPQAESPKVLYTLGE